MPMKKVVYETKDFLSFEPHEWKKVSSNPEIYEGLKDNIIVKFHDYEKEGEIGTQTLSRLVFNKGEKVELSTIGDKFILSCDDREVPIGESGESFTMDLRIEKDDEK